MKKIVIAGVLLCLLAMGAVAASADVQATGEGPDKELALVTAKRRAVEQGVGTYLESSTVVVNSELVEDKILSRSNGYVTSFKILREGKSGDGYAVTISAKVDGKALKEDIDDLTVLRKNMGNPRIMVAYRSMAEEGEAMQGEEFVDDVYSGIVELLTDRQFRVVDRSAAEKFASQVADTHGTDVDLNRAAQYGLKYNAEYTLYYRGAAEVKQGAVQYGAKLRIKAQLIDNTRAQVITSKTVETAGSGQTRESALEKAALDGGRKVVGPMLEIIRKNWSEMALNGQPYTLVVDGVDDPEEIARLTAMLEKFPLVHDSREVESGGGKTTLEATYKGKREQLDRDVLRAAKELGWKIRLVRAEGARSTWKRQQ